MSEEPVDITAEVRGFLAESIARRRFGVKYGYDVSWQPVQMPGPQGPISGPLYTLLITRRSPLLGQPSLHHMAQIPCARPSAEQVDEQVADGLRQLAELFERLKKPPEAAPVQRPVAALANGHRR